MNKTLLLFVVCLITFSAAQWPCQDWGFNGPIPNCASCTYVGSMWNYAQQNLGQDALGNAMLAYAVCTSCTTGFFLNQTACQNCTAFCNFCNFNGACNKGGCAKGYYWYPLTSWCLPCNATNCLQCEMSFSYQSNAPFSSTSSPSTAGSRIKDWTSPIYDPIGSQFNGSYWNTTNNYWQPPAYNNDAFYGTGPTTCTQCQSNYYINSAGACTACPTGATCSMASGRVSISCNTGYWIQWASGVATCTQCVANGVGLCNSATAYAATIVQNIFGGGSATIAANSFAAASVQSSTLVAAATAQSAYYTQGGTGGSYWASIYLFTNLLPNAGGYINPCNPGYALTSVSTCTATTITGCVAAIFTQSTQLCMVGPGACNTGFVSPTIALSTQLTVANTLLTTTACATSTAGATCMINDPYDAAWSTTASTSACSVCVAGYVLNSGTKACVACPTGCWNQTLNGLSTQPLSCYWNGAAAVCTICSTNYTLLQTDTTVSTVISTQSASQSLFGYLQSSAGVAGAGIVQPSPSPVTYHSSWFSLNPTTATFYQTLLGASTNIYYNSQFNAVRGTGGTCLACPGNCSHCQATAAGATTTQCLQCYPGFGLIFNYTTNTTSCQKCNTTGCVTCDGLGVCTTCNVTMYLAPNQCQQCPYNCSVCANSTYCFNNCTKNYVYNSVTGQCLPNGGEKIILASFALLSVLLYFIQ